MKVPPAFLRELTDEQLVERFGVHPDFEVESADAVPSSPPPQDEEHREAA